jgi:hypothetical protein
MSKRFRPSAGTVLGFLALMAATGGLAVAVTSSGNTIHGCVDKGTGILHVLHGHQHCTHSQRKLDFNKQGAPGAAIVLRARGTSRVVTESCSGTSCTPYPAQTYPIAPTAWTQASNELDQLFGQATITSPSSSCASPVTVGPTIIVVDAGRSLASFFNFPAPAAGTTTTVSLFSPAVLFEPGATTRHALSVHIGDSCTTGAHYTIDSVKLDIVAMR